MRSHTFAPNIVNDAAPEMQGSLNPPPSVQALSPVAICEWTVAAPPSAPLTPERAFQLSSVTTMLVTDESWNGLASILSTPVRLLNIGSEQIYAEHTPQGGQSGNLAKIQTQTRENFQTGFSATNRRSPVDNRQHLMALANIRQFLDAHQAW